MASDILAGNRWRRKKDDEVIQVLESIGCPRWPLDGQQQTTRKLTNDFRYEFEEVAVTAIDAARDHISREGA